MRSKLLVIFLVLVLACTGCALKGSQTGQTGTDEQKKADDKAAGDTVEVVDVVPGQNSNPVLTPGDHGENLDGIKQTLTVLIDSLILNDMQDVGNCLHGLDEGGSAVTVEELQKEMAQLHPVQWSVVNYQLVGERGALVTLSYTMPDGTVREAASFSMQNEESLWTVHYNSFADSIHNIARHVIKKTDTPTDTPIDN
ncbi:hypothetical protein ABDB91_15615 [Desulfoscipio sp. XC116]|uniref:hypothetical protein n=1 Tax=Desulfoscipio sp. XC116 TaxID=3144975 RepID=UPI00325B470E